MQVNISGLNPDQHSLQKGQLFGFTLKASHWADILTHQLDAKYKTLVTFLDNTQGYPISSQDNLQILQFKPSKALFKSRVIQRLCGELKHSCPQPSLIIIDATQSLFIEPGKKRGVANLMYLRQWAHRTGHAVVLYFSALNTESVATFIWQQQSQFHGLVDISGEFSPKHWHTLHWFGTSKTFANEHYLLTTNNNLMTAQHSSVPDEVIQNTPKEAVIIVDKHYPQIGSKLNEQWLITHDDQKIYELAHANPHAVVILHLFANTDLYLFTKMIHQLRKDNGNNLKIIIHKVSFKLRQSEQNLLRHMGANIVLPAELGSSTLYGIIDSIRFIKFYHDIDSDFETSFKRSMIVTAKSYQEPLTFIEICNKLIHTASQFGISFSLVQLQTSINISPLETVKYSNCQRNGDIFTIINAQVYFFFYGCREEHINSTLEKVIGTRASSLYQRQRNFCHYENAGILLTQLQDIVSTTPQALYGKMVNAAIKTHNIDDKQQIPNSIAPIPNKAIMSVPIATKFKE
ncbi:BcsE family c-di-GMP-binding protein [Paraferrimonas sp. SM1919]|uniref:BcsE family c-di-GMP-binding protein n=1 Tax=Paraferrimonas sp. SM1919 TaxID=2662263 RepID=UPI0013D2B422|nr:BcsE family c-di-GMP-binding protein [Paraferrimonas sp. SM1919]